MFEFKARGWKEPRCTITASTESVSVRVDDLVHGDLWAELLLTRDQLIELIGLIDNHFSSVVDSLNAGLPALENTELPPL